MLGFPLSSCLWFSRAGGQGPVRGRSSTTAAGLVSAATSSRAGGDDSSRSPPAVMRLHRSC